jgi:hypothetical protein
MVIAARKRLSLQVAQRPAVGALAITGYTFAEGDRAA